LRFGSVDQKKKEREMKGNKLVRWWKWWLWRLEVVVYGGLLEVEDDEYW
jgi:hypothetical protein